jgi:hypothetical protein
MFDKESGPKGSGFGLPPEGVELDEIGIMEQWNDGVKKQKRPNY